jgi:predicted secreted hydrolase
MAHFALTDVSARQFHAREQFARGAAGLAGADTSPFRVWVGPWSIASTAQPAAPAQANSPSAIFPLQLQAADGDVRLDLELDVGKPLVLHGDSGMSVKGAQPGNASYYLSFTRMPTTGRVRTESGEVRVTGESWLDREWGTSGLPANVAGWDWFALQLEDGTELMFYHLRRSDGTMEPFSAGTLVDPAGGTAGLVASDVELQVLDTWSSPLDGARYPARWRLRLARLDFDVEITPVLANQELNLSVRYWEGAVDVAGRREARELRGRGYVEMTGYGEAAAPSLRASRRASASIVNTVGRASASGNTLASHTYSPATSVSSSLFTTVPMRAVAHGCVPRSGVVMRVAGSQPASRRIRAAISSAC